MKISQDTLIRFGTLGILTCCIIYLMNDPIRLFNPQFGGINKGIVEKDEQFKSDSIYQFQSVVWAINDEAKESEHIPKEEILQTYFKSSEYENDKMYLLLVGKNLFVQLNENKAVFFGNDPRTKQRFNELANKDPKLLLEHIIEAKEKNENRPDLPHLKAGEYLFTVSDIRPSKEHLWESYQGETRAIKYITDYTNTYQDYLKMKGERHLASNIKTVEKVR